MSRSSQLPDRHTAQDVRLGLPALAVRSASSRSPVRIVSTVRTPVATAVSKTVVAAATRGCNSRGVQRGRKQHSDRRRRYGGEFPTSGKKFSPVLFRVRNLVARGHVYP